MLPKSLTAILLAVLVFASCGNERRPRQGNNVITDTPRPDMATPMDAGGDAGGDAGDPSDAQSDADQDGPREMGADADPTADAAPDDACVPETDEEMCLRYGFECGPLQDLDNCGDMRSVATCGDPVLVCEANEVCGANNTPGTCGCEPQSCEQLGVLCGPVDDTCGGGLNCDLFCVDTISAGAEHNCAIGSGKMKCWGKGADGALGTGTATLQKNPVDVMGLTSTVTKVAAGGHHTCVVDSGQRVVCWGRNDRAQLGIGTTVDSNLPGMAAITSGADLVVAGDRHTCALSGGKVECWGSNEFGQIGDPSFNINASVGVPTLPAGLDANVTQITAGLDHNCVIQDDPATARTGLVKCWGRNKYAQVSPLPVLGNVEGFDYWGYLTPPGWDLSSLVNQPTIVNDASGQPFTNVKAVAAGKNHTCIIDASDEIWCWGFIPGFDPATSCPRVNNKTPSECSVWPRPNGILVGALNTAGDALNSIAGMWVASVPQQVPLAKTPIALAGGDDHHCARVSDPDPGAGNIYCWGRSQFGQVGDGTNNHWTDPRLVIPDIDGDAVLATEVDLGGAHSCALVDNSNIVCWGSNASGQIGNSDLQRDESFRPFDVRLAISP